MCFNRAERLVITAGKWLELFWCILATVSTPKEIPASEVVLVEGLLGASVFGVRSADDP